MLQEQVIEMVYYPDPDKMNRKMRKAIIPVLTKVLRPLTTIEDIFLEHLRDPFSPYSYGEMYQACLKKYTAAVNELKQENLKGLKINEHYFEQVYKPYESEFKKSKDE